MRKTNPNREAVSAQAEGAGWTAKGKSSVRLAIALSMAVLLSACIPEAMKKAASASDAGAGDTIVVVKVELVPPLKKEEQHFKWNDVGTNQFKNAIWLLTDDKYRKLEAEPGFSEYKNRLELQLGETGYFVTEDKPFYVLTGTIVMSMQPIIQRMYVPGGFKVNIHKGDQAVYLGTIRYYRDEFSEVTKAEVIDDYNREYKRFRKKFGNGIRLKKRLITGK